MVPAGVKLNEEAAQAEVFCVGVSTGVGLMVSTNVVLAGAHGLFDTVMVSVTVTGTDDA
jgi:hypothetical protein